MAPFFCFLNLLDFGFMSITEQYFTKPSIAIPSSSRKSGVLTFTEPASWCHLRDSRTGLGTLLPRFQRQAASTHSQRSMPQTHRVPPLDSETPAPHGIHTSKIFCLIISTSSLCSPMPLPAGGTNHIICSSSEK